MKLKSSASVSSASATTTAGCFSKLFARIFRSPSFPIQLSDYTAPATSYQQEFNPIERITHGDSPGIVAKLMGLDFIPPFHLVETPGSITRSKSTNDVHTREKCDQSHRPHISSTTTLFHEFPTELQNEDYFILSFQGGVETRKKSSKPRKKKKQNHYFVSENAEQPISISSSSQDSSPVSVLDYITDSEDSSISEDVATIQKPNSQRKLSLQLEKTIVEFGDDRKVAMTEESCKKSSTSDFHCRDNNNLFGEICWQSKAEAVEPIWTLRNNWKLEDFVDINESAIWDRLLEDTIDQLVEHHSTRSKNFSTILRARVGGPCKITISQGKMSETIRKPSLQLKNKRAMNITLENSKVVRRITKIIGKPIMLRHESKEQPALVGYLQ